jgi:hypothetical protein
MGEVDHHRKIESAVSVVLAAVSLIGPLAAVVYERFFACVDAANA